MGAAVGWWGTSADIRQKTKSAPANNSASGAVKVWVMAFKPSQSQN